MQPSVPIVYKGLLAGSAARAIAAEYLAQQASQLDRYRADVSCCRVGVERWRHHQHSATNLRVSVELVCDDQPLSAVRESEGEPTKDALRGLLDDAFQSALRSLGRAKARARHAAPHLSAEARRLHALHGRASEDADPTIDTGM